ncbi:MAG: hypothetical protein ABDH37_07650 [Candidatus Hydrothermales bacterium]
MKKIKILTGGSDRIFINDIHFMNYIKIVKFLYKKGIKVFKIYFYDLKSKVALFEDIGDTSLFRVFKIVNGLS